MRGGEGMKRSEEKEIGRQGERKREWEKDRGKEWENGRMVVGKKERKKRKESNFFFLIEEKIKERKKAKGKMETGKRRNSETNKKVTHEIGPCSSETATWCHPYPRRCPQANARSRLRLRTWHSSHRRSSFWMISGGKINTIYIFNDWNDGI